MQQRHTIRHIEQQHASLRPSERKVAEYVLAHPEDAMHMRIVDLAAAAAVSEPTVVRFCRAIGCDSFADFKLSLAQSPSPPGPSLEGFQLEELDRADDYTRKVFESALDTLQQVRDSLDTAAIEQAVDALCRARRVEFYGFGASGSVAVDAQHKFFRLQISSAAYSDPHIQTMSASSLAPEDVVVAISQSGRSRALLEAIDLVRDSGATTIGLAPGGTPVAQRCAIPIHIDVDQDPAERYTPLPSRLAHLAVIDVLAVGVSKTKGADINAHLGRLNRSLKSLRVDQ